MKTRIVIILGVAIIIAAFILAHSNRPQHINTGVKWSEEAEQEQTGYIAINGFSEIHFQADTKAQDFEFHNSEKNNCYMDVSLALADGTELFKIHSLAAGYGVHKVLLNQELPKGEYEDCSLSIQCYSSADHTQMNGTALSVDLYVR